MEEQKSSFETLMEMYSSIYDCTFESCVLIEKLEFEELNHVIERRAGYIAKAETIIIAGGFTAEQQVKISEWAAKIKQLDAKNMENIQACYEEAKKEMAKNSHEKKVLSAYRVNREVVPHYIDSKE